MALRSHGRDPSRGGSMPLRVRALAGSVRSWGYVRFAEVRAPRGPRPPIQGPHRPEGPLAACGPSEAWVL